MDLKPMLRWELERLMARRFPHLDERYANSLWGLVVKHYGDPSRHYHDLRHIEEMVEFILLRAPRLTKRGDLGEVAQRFADEEVDKLLFAAIFHDFIYDTQATKGSNEERSATFAWRYLDDLATEESKHTERRSTWTPPRFGVEVHDLILVTIDHDAKTDAEKLFCDADLARFALDWPGFVDNNQVAIRQEYGWVSDEAWQAGRAAVLEHYLLRDPMFYFATDLTPLAEANLVRALRQVKKGQPLTV